MIQFAAEPGGREAFDAFLRGLLVADWKSATGPMRFSPSLTASELAEVPFFRNVRALLSGLDEAGATQATATGNLNRVFVRRMFDRLVLPEPYRQSVLRVCKVFNEQEVWPLHLARIVSECAGLVVRRKKRFQLTRVGRELLPETQAGILFRRLFIAYFRDFNLHYDFNLRDVPGIQQTMAVILWRLDTVARDWVPVRGLAIQVLLPGVLRQLHATMNQYDKEEWILSGYVLNPLERLGLLEAKKKSEWPFTEDDELRLTGLWRRFIHFEPWAERR